MNFVTNGPVAKMFVHSIACWQRMPRILSPGRRICPESFSYLFCRRWFYGSGTKWAPRTSKWGKKFTHPVLIDSGELKSKIKGQKANSVHTARSENGTTADATITTSGRKKKVRPWMGIVERKRKIQELRSRTQHRSEVRIIYSA